MGLGKIRQTGGWNMRTKQVEKFDRQAETYERKRIRQELGHLRKRLLGHARGHVLELGVGAGANFPYYTRDIKLTAVDFSPAMLDKAKAANAAGFGLQVTFIESDVDSLSLPEQTYDTVVSTLSLCAYGDPAQVLRNLNRWCKPGGEVLLMEHGISSNKLLAAAQRAVDPLAFRLVGCHQNRDIVDLVRRSPLAVVREEQHMIGMLHLLWCRPTHETF